MADFHKPTRFPGDRFDEFQGAEDPAHEHRVARETAHALLARARASEDPHVVDRLIHFTDEHGLDTVAELWATSAATSLPGALWRIYLLRVMILQNADDTSFLFQRGTEVLRTIDPIVAGAEMPTGPAEIIDLADRILRGVFEGDFAIALERAAAFCRVEAAGSTSVADDREDVDPARASALTTRALRLTTMAVELSECAALYRRDSLD